MSTTEMQTPTMFVRVQAPPQYANALLNGSEGVVVHRWEHVATVLLLDGPNAGREWQFNADHLAVRG